MAADIGAKIGIDGEKSFRDSLSAINSELKTLGSEMKLAVAEFEGMENSQEAATVKGDILSRSIQVNADKIKLLQGQYERAKNKLSTLEDELQKMNSEFGESSEQALKAQNAYNRQVKSVNDLSQKINTATADMKKMQTRLSRLGDEASDTSKEMDTLGDTFKGTFLGNIVADGVTGLASSLLELTESTKEYNKIMGTLETASAKAGYSSAETSKSYQTLYGVLGDQQQAATALSNLQALKLPQEQLNELIDGAIGAWATYGDSIPIDGLAEAINETVKAGTVTGTFADVLNWAGTNEDAFNEKLAAAKTEAERVNLVMEELSGQGLPGVADAWRENNAELVKSNEATAELESATGRLGEMFLPIATSFREKQAEIANGFADMLEEGNPILALATGIAAALATMGLAMFITSLGGVAGALGKAKAAMIAFNTAIKANPIGLVVSLLAGLAAALITAYQTNDTFREKVDVAWAKVKETVGGAVSTLKKFFTEDIPNAVEEAKSWLSEIPENMKQLGKDIIEGLWGGIHEKWQWLKGKVSGFIGSIKDSFTGKDGFDTHSPSKWSHEVGENVDEGLANGLDSKASIVEEAADQIKINVTDSIDDLIGEVESRKETLESKLEGYGDLFERILDESGGEIFSLTNLEEQIADMERYGDLLADFQQKAVPQNLFDDVLGLDIGDATAYMEELLSMSDEKWNEYISLYEQKEQAIARVSQELFGDQLKAFQAIAKDGTSSATGASALAAEAVSGTVLDGEQSFAAAVEGMREQEPLLFAYAAELKERAIETAESFQPDFVKVGLYCMEGLAKGILDGESGVINAVASVVAAAIAKAKARLDINSPSGVFEKFGAYSAEGYEIGWLKKIPSVMRTVQKGLGGVSNGFGSNVNNSRSYNFGGIVLNIAKVENSNGRTVETFARELEFFRRQQALAKGGAT